MNTEKTSDRGGSYTKSTKVVDVINDLVFEEYGRLIFPVDQRIDDDLKLQDVDDILIWYNNVNPVFMIFIQRRKKRGIPRKKIPACFSSAVNEMQKQP